MKIKVSELRSLIREAVQEAYAQESDDGSVEESIGGLKQGAVASALALALALGLKPSDIVDGEISPSSLPSGVTLTPSSTGNPEYQIPAANAKLTSQVRDAQKQLSLRAPTPRPGRRSDSGWGSSLDRFRSQVGTAIGSPTEIDPATGGSTSRPVNINPSHLHNDGYVDSLRRALSAGGLQERRRRTRRS